MKTTRRAFMAALIAAPMAKPLAQKAILVPIVEPYRSQLLSKPLMVKDLRNARTIFQAKDAKPIKGSRFIAYIHPDNVEYYRRTLQASS